MVGIILAILCWALWLLEPAHGSVLDLGRSAVQSGQWWRLWTASLTSANFNLLIFESTAILMMGLILQLYVRWWHLLAGILFGLPIMNWLLIHFEPGLSHYRSATGLVAMMWLLGTCFLIVECKRFSFLYLVGQFLLLIAIAKVGLETWMLYFSHRTVPDGYRLIWEQDLCGALIGIALFNGLHQIYKGRIENRARPQLDQYGKAVPRPLNQHRPVDPGRPAPRRGGVAAQRRPGPPRR